MNTFMFFMFYYRYFCAVPSVMAGPGVFHVEFGINETKLTQLLERRRYNEAANLIQENTNPSYLDEGNASSIDPFHAEFIVGKNMFAFSNIFWH